MPLRTKKPRKHLRGFLFGGLKSKTPPAFMRGLRFRYEDSKELRSAAACPLVYRP